MVTMSPGQSAGSMLVPSARIRTLPPEARISAARSRTGTTRCSLISLIRGKELRIPAIEPALKLDGTGLPTRQGHGLENVFVAVARFSVWLFRIPRAAGAVALLSGRAIVEAVPAWLWPRRNKGWNLIFVVYHRCVTPAGTHSVTRSPRLGSAPSAPYLNCSNCPSISGSSGRVARIRRC